MKHLIILLILIPFSLSAQKWVYKIEKNAFDGDYKYAYVTGKGGKFPYHDPNLVINYFTKSGSLNIYINDAGYSGCDDSKIYFKFDNQEDVLFCDASSNDENDIWFFTFDNDQAIKAMLDVMKKSKIIHVRLKSECYQADYEFSLTGSTVAIDFVCKEFFEELKNKEN